jgi:hypothetical protein
MLTPEARERKIRRQRELRRLRRELRAEPPRAKLTPDEARRRREARDRAAKLRLAAERRSLGVFVDLLRQCLGLSALPATDFASKRA